MARMERIGQKLPGQMRGIDWWGKGGQREREGECQFMDIADYLNTIRTLAASGQATEHSYRPALERLFTSISPDISVINEPKRLTDVGAPDFVFSDKDIITDFSCKLHEQI